MSLPGQVLTDRSFKSEPEASGFFDRIVEQSGLFTIYRLVPGFYVQPRAWVQNKNCEIDRILAPKAALLEAGWKHGLLGVEIKTGGMKIGEALCQALDYSRAVFKLPGNRGLVMLEWIFLFPLSEPPLGDIGSVMTNNRIGSACFSRSGGLRFMVDQTVAIALWEDGKVEAKELNMGKKVGSR